MELKQLEYFMVLCKELHFTRAAEKLNISQPSLSQQIRNLEYELGVPLFDRIGKKTALTKAGRILHVHSQKIFNEIEQARGALAEFNGLQRGKLKIGALLTVVNYLLPPIILEFHNLYPKIELSILGLRTGKIRRGLLENELDLGIVFLPLEDAELQSIPLCQEELSLVVPTNHELAERSAVSLHVLKNIPSILFPSNYFLRQLINNYCKELGFLPKPILESTTIESIINLVAKNVGVTVLPKPYLECLENNSIRVIPLVDPTPTRQIGIIYRKEKYMCPATRIFIDLLTKGL